MTNSISSSSSINSWLLNYLQSTRQGAAASSGTGSGSSQGGSSWVIGNSQSTASLDQTTPSGSAADVATPFQQFDSTLQSLLLQAQSADSTATGDSTGAGTNSLNSLGSGSDPASGVHHHLHHLHGGGDPSQEASGSDAPTQAADTTNGTAAQGSSTDLAQQLLQVTGAQDSSSLLTQAVAETSL